MSQLGNFDSLKHFFVGGVGLCEKNNQISDVLITLGM